MARARNIKPGFFINEELVTLPPFTRLLFIGLWTLADREGRLEDRPLRVKMAIFPADNVNVDEALNQLQDKRLIVRYVVDGERFIEISNFTKHQKPHQNETDSVIPRPQALAPMVEARGSESLLSESLTTDCPTTESPRSAKRAKRPAKALCEIPDDFQLTDTMRKWAKEKAPTLEIERETQKFIERCRAKGTQYKDWVAGWRTQMLNAVDWAKNDAKPVEQKRKGTSDMLSPDYDSGVEHHTPFEIAVFGADTVQRGMTPEYYRELRAEWLESNPRYSHEVDEYERGREFRERFSEAGQDAFGSGAPASRGNGNGPQTSVPVPR